MSGNNDGWSFNRFNEYEAKLKGEKVEETTEEVVEEETLEEGMHREADTGKVVDKAEVGKTYYPAQPKKKTSVALRKEKEAKEVKEGVLDAALKTDKKVAELQKKADEDGKRAAAGKSFKEELEATGLFSAEEIEALVEASSCGSKGYQKGGEVEEEGNSKPDYLDFDKDGNKKESMKKALKEKGAKKN